MALRVGVKYCGHCNPVVDTPGLLAHIKARRPEWEWVTWKQAEDGPLILCGCPKACATPPSFDGPTVLVAGDTLNGQRYNMAELADQVIQMLLPKEGMRGMPSQSMDIRDKVILITGATKGIGYGLVLGLARAGADIVAVSRHQQDCDRVAEEVRGLGRRALAIAADVTRIETLQAMVQETVQEFGRIDVLVNNAGNTLTKKAEELTEADWDSVVNVALKGAFFCAQQVGRQMIAQQRGKIINMASMFGLVGEKYVLPYLAAKGGLVQITKGLALEWARYNIQVNALCPGYVLTELNRGALADEKIYNNIIKNTPIRRLAAAEDLLGATIFLASEASNYMTGATLVIDGGWTAA